MLSDEDLKGIAAQALNMAKHDLELGRFNFLLAACNESGTIKLLRMAQAEALIIERLGQDWLNHGRTKDLGFSGIRSCIDLKPPDAVVFATMCNGFSMTEKFHALAPEQQKELVNRGHDAHHQAVADGLMLCEDILSAIVQTPERVCHYVQKVERGQFVGHPEARFSPQKDFDGRIKMFGKGKHAFSQR